MSVQPKVAKAYAGKRGGCATANERHETGWVSFACAITHQAKQDFDYLHIRGYAKDGKVLINRWPKKTNGNWAVRAMDMTDAQTAMTYWFTPEFEELARMTGLDPVAARERLLGSSIR